MICSAPCHLSDEYCLDDFCSGEALLDEWLKLRARRNEISGASRTYIISVNTRVIGYYSLAVGSVAHALTPGRVRRNMPDPVPVMLLGRLAVDRSMQGRGLGRALVRDAVLRTAQAAHIAGIRAMLVHALNEKAAHFYLSCGFLPSPVNDHVLMLPLKGISK